MKILFLFFTLFISINSFAQYQFQWYAEYDHPYMWSYYDEPADLIEDKQGNVYVTGVSWGLGDDQRYDIATIKYNSEGDSLWVKRYNYLNVYSSYEEPVKIDLDNNENVIVAGNGYEPNVSGSAMILLKYDSSGNNLWTRRYYDSAYDYRTELRDFIQDKEGNIYICGYSTGRTVTGCGKLLKFDSNGNLIWMKSYKRNLNDYTFFNSIDLDSQGNIFVTGYTTDNDFDSLSFITAKYNQQGDTIWVRRAAISIKDYAFSIKADAMGNCYTSGYSYVDPDNYNMSLIKYDANGNLQWTRNLTGRSDINGYLPYPNPKMLNLDSQGFIYVNFMSYQGHNKIALAKYNSNGDYLWANLYSPPLGTSVRNETRDFQILPTGRIFVTGESRNDTSKNRFVILEYDVNGNQKNIIRNVNDFHDHFYPSALFVNNSGEIFVTGMSEGPSWYDEYPNYFTVKYSDVVGIEPVNSALVTNFTLHQNYPNPFNPVTKIRFDVAHNERNHSNNVKLTIYNMQGKEILILLNKKMDAGSYEVEFDGSDLSGGVYFYKLVSGSFSETRKMILLK